MSFYWFQMLPQQYVRMIVSPGTNVQSISAPQFIPVSSTSCRQDPCFSVKLRNVSLSTTAASSSARRIFISTPSSALNCSSETNSHTPSELTTPISIAEKLPMACSSTDEKPSNNKRSMAEEPIQTTNSRENIIILRENLRFFLEKILLWLIEERRFLLYIDEDDNARFLLGFNATAMDTSSSSSIRHVKRFRYSYSENQKCTVKEWITTMKVGEDGKWLDRTEHA